MQFASEQTKVASHVERQPRVTAASESSCCLPSYTTLFPMRRLPARRVLELGRVIGQVDLPDRPNPTVQLETPANRSNDQAEASATRLLGGTCVPVWFVGSRRPPDGAASGLTNQAGYRHGLYGIMPFGMKLVSTPGVTSCANPGRGPPSRVKLATAVCLSHTTFVGWSVPSSTESSS